jgi:hypothetical protein
MAFWEGTPTVKDTPSTPAELAKELHQSMKRISVRARLRTWTRALTTVPAKTVQKYNWLLLSLNLQNQTIGVTGYRDRKEAGEALAAIERQQSRGDVDVVLVRVDSIANLRTAYPNYYADTRVFMDVLNGFLEVYRP